jgi:hypothetical protein
MKKQEDKQVLATASALMEALNKLPKTEQEYIEELDANINIKVLSGGEREEYESFVINQTKGGKQVNIKGLRGKLISLCVVDAEGNRIFDNPADAIAFGGNVVRSIFESCQRVNKLGDDGITSSEKN